MTEEQLDKAAKDYCVEVEDSWVGDAFKAGAKWAMEQVDKRYLDGFEQGVKSVWETTEDE